MPLKPPPKLVFRDPKRLFGASIYNTMFHPKYFIKKLLDLEMITYTGMYSSDVYDMCMNGATYLATILSNGLGEECTIMNGAFDSNHHCWVKWNELYLDYTLCQFNPVYPQLAIVSANKYNEWPLFQVEEEVSCEAWALRHM